MPLKPDDRSITPGASAGGGARALTIAFVLVAVCAVIVYSGSMHAPFVLDDEFIIVKNPLAHSVSSLWPPVDPRYIGYVTFALNYSLGGLDTFGYHAVNLAIHIINGLLVYALVVSLFTAARASGYSTRSEADPMFLSAIAAALLFTVHPVNTQAVTYIVQRFASLSALFYLLSVVLYLEWRRSSAAGGSKGRGAALYILSLLSTVAAQKTKEVAFTLPFVLVLLELAVVPVKEGEGLIKRLALLVPFLLTLFIIPVSMFAAVIIHPPAPAAAVSGAAASAPAQGGLSRFVPGDLKLIAPYDYLLTQFRVIITYLRLMVLPVSQTLEYDYPVYHSLFSPAPLLGLLFHICALAGAAYIYARARAGRDLLLLLISFGIFWFYITLSIESSIIPLRDVIFEHRVYLPGVGLFISFSAAFLYALGRAGEKHSSEGFMRTAVVVLLCLTALPLAAASYKRNLLWSDKVALYEDTARKSPGNPRVRNNLGVEYGKLGRYEDAIVEFKTTLRLKPDFIETYKNLANAYYQSGRPGEAIAVYLAALKLVPTEKTARKNLADIYYEKGLVEDAVREYETLLRYYPDYVDIRNNLASIFLSEGRLDDAVREYEKVLAVKPRHVESIYNIAIALEKKGDMDRAAYYYKRFLQYAPPEYGAYKEDVRARLAKMGRR